MDTQCSVFGVQRPVKSVRCSVFGVQLERVVSGSLNTEHRTPNTEHYVLALNENHDLGPGGGQIFRLRDRRRALAHAQRGNGAAAEPAGLVRLLVAEKVD